MSGSRPHPNIVRWSNKGVPLPLFREVLVSGGRLRDWDALIRPRHQLARFDAYMSMVEALDAELQSELRRALADGRLATAAGLGALWLQFAGTPPPRVDWLLAEDLLEPPATEDKAAWARHAIARQVARYPGAVVSKDTDLLAMRMYAFDGRYTPLLGSFALTWRITVGDHGRWAAGAAARGAPVLRLEVDASTSVQDLQKRVARPAFARMRRPQPPRAPGMRRRSRSGRSWPWAGSRRVAPTWSAPGEAWSPRPPPRPRAGWR